jgi:peptide/nickel transport system ATP-binding protein
VSEEQSRSLARERERGAGEPLLDVRGLEKHYPITEGVLKKQVGSVRAVDGISFAIDRGETLGLVGESGCGKSTAAENILRLEDPTGGEVYFDGQDVTGIEGERLKRFRRRAQIVFQDPTSSFDPRMSVGESITEPLLIHGMRDRERRREIGQNLLERVGLSADDYGRYPHEFSGGQKQRIGLARSLVLNPDLIVADEPVSALDVSIKTAILNLIDDLQQEFDLSILLISHDMGVVRQVCDRVAVMYLGKIVELGPTEQLFDDPQHPYTQALISSIPRPDPNQRGESVRLSGTVPSPSNPPSGCRFHTRCPQVIQPEGYSFEQAEWRSLMDVRHRLETGELDLDAIRELQLAEGDEDGSSVDTETLKGGVREEFDLPATLSSQSAEAVFAEALDQVVEEEFGAAASLLAEEFETVCEREEPPLDGTAAGQLAACHLHDDAVEPELDRMGTD